MIKTDFGIIITCYVGDYFLTKGLLASIHMFMPHIPICIIQDGDFSIEEERKLYNISHVIKKADVKNDFLRENCFGSRCTNMIAFWESPFEYFFYIDSDTVAWGDVTKNIEYWNYDFIHNKPHEEYTEFIIKQQYLNFEKLFTSIPSIDVYKHHFFNAGVFIAKRGIFDMECYKELFRIWKIDKKLFGPEPQGFINYMIFQLVEQNKAKVHEVQLQELVPVYDRKTLVNMFSEISNEIMSPTIIHWAGMKPLFINRNNVYSDPSLYFRKQNLKDKKNVMFLFSKLYFLLEENIMLLHKYFKGSLYGFLASKLRQIYVFKIRYRINFIKDILMSHSIESKRESILKRYNVKDYPFVIPIEETINQLVEKNTSLACFDFDSFNLSFDCNVQSQVKDKEIRYRFRNIIQQTRNNHCLIAIPSFNDVDNSEVDFWYHNGKYLNEIFSIDERYYSSYFSNEYSVKLSKLWINRNIIIVTECEIDTTIFNNVESTFEIRNNDKNYWGNYNNLQKRIINEVSSIYNPIIFLLIPIISPILSYDLSKLGLQTIDFRNMYPILIQKNVFK